MVWYMVLVSRRDVIRFMNNIIMNQKHALGSIIKCEHVVFFVTSNLVGKCVFGLSYDVNTSFGNTLYVSDHT